MDARDAANRDLLFGLLALQNGLVDQDQLVTAFRQWTRDKAKPLADHLVALGQLDPSSRGVVEALVGLHLKRNGGDPERSLTALHTGRSTREGLAGLGDPDIEATLGHVGSGPDATRTGDSNSEDTASYAVGAATSDGRRFRVLRPHAKGGLGAVFVALDGELNREVALKQILDRHADDPASRTRFVLEAEITGGLEHPGIVPVYGLGSYGDGRPYYAMRFIKGETLKDAIAAFQADGALKHDPGKRALGLRKLLRRFVDVCNAVDYAHTRGVIHRDIKPVNVIVGRHGETLVVDWGLAKAVGGTDAGSPSDERVLTPGSAGGSAETLPGSAMGTPAYMSPEQAAGDSARVGSHSDVYSLGATLYCLLTGKPPFEDDDLGAVLRAVQNGEFPTPRSLDRSIPPGLEAACLKAMANSPADRYASPRALAEDVERWMADEPVSALPEGPLARLARVARRNRAWVQAGTAALALVALVATVAALAVDRSRRAERSARARVSRALTAELAARAEAQSNLAKADANLALARKAVDDYFTKVSEDTLLKRQDAPDVRDLRQLRKQLLEVALAYYREFAGQHGEDEALQAELATAYERVSRITAEIETREAALAPAERSAEIRSRLLKARPEDRAARLALAKALLHVAKVSGQLKRSDQALRAHLEVGRVLDGLAAAEPDAPDVLTVLGENDESTGLLSYFLGRPGEGVASLERASRTLGRLAGRHPGNLEYARAWGRAESNLGTLQSSAGREEAGLASFERSVAIVTPLVEARGHDTGLASSLSMSLNNIGVLHHLQGRYDAAISAYERSRAISARLAAEHPTVSGFGDTLALAQFNTGELHVLSGRPAEALASFAPAEAILSRRYAADPDYEKVRGSLALVLNGTGMALRMQGRDADARAAVARAIRLHEGRPRPTSHELHQLARSYAIRSTLDDEPGESSADAARAVETLRRAVAAGFAIPTDIRSDPALEPLRPRPDFQALLLDLEFPADPFARQPEPGATRR